MLRKMMTLFQEMVPQLFQSCPWQGRFEITNLKQNKKFTSLLPKGYFQFETKASSGDKKTSTSVKIEYEIY